MYGLKSFGFSGVDARIVSVVGDCCEGAAMRRSPCGVDANDFMGLLSLLDELKSYLLFKWCSLSDPGDSERILCCDVGLWSNSCGGVHWGFGIVNGP